MDEQLTAFKSCRREIRGSQIIADDLACFQTGCRVKVPGTTLNVIGALIQRLAERDGHSDFAVFSSWLSPLISGEFPQGTHYGTIEGHILNAVCLSLDISDSCSNSVSARDTPRKFSSQKRGGYSHYSSKRLSIGFWDTLSSVLGNFIYLTDLLS
jgi:hypothetical protein